MKDSTLKYGDIVKWTYMHSLNITSKTAITKTGMFIGNVRHTVKHWRKSDSVQMSKVHFEGNIYKSVVPRDEIVPISRPAQQAEGNKERE